MIQFFLTKLRLHYIHYRMIIVMGGNKNKQIKRQMLKKN